MPIKPFTLNYFVLSTLCKESSGLDLNGLKEGLLRSAPEDDVKVIKDGSLYGTLSKLKSAGCVQTTIDIVLNSKGEDMPVRRYFVTGKGKSVLLPAIKNLKKEESRIRDIDFNGIPDVGQSAAN